ncbi:MAG TPA: FHA domain-containing protein [Candidatus Acidoferrales bacterium]|jgi:hypothetical protein|nr:FHA domain-containing protein [Candidatus Acidoferrales bacterium]
MEAQCGHCGTKHTLNDKQVGNHTKVQFKCSGCGQMTVVNVALRPDRTRSSTPLPGFARSEGAHEVLAEMLKDAPELKLPADRIISLAVTSGLSNGTVHTLNKPRVILGRRGGGADFEVDDPEVSRWHCAVEVKDGAVWLKDLESTNGTYYDNERTRAAMLQDGIEFRIGSTILRVNISPKR